MNSLYIGFSLKIGSDFDNLAIILKMNYALQIPWKNRLDKTYFFQKNKIPVSFYPHEEGKAIIIIISS